MTKKNNNSGAKKRKSPIRFEAIIPILIILTAGWAYTTLFLDFHLKHALEFVASRIHGAQVDVAAVTTSFKDPSLTITGIEVTDLSNPAQNTAAIEKIHLALLWDGLLRAKLVIPESSINGLAINSPRKSPGKVYPVRASKAETKSSVTQQLQEELKAEAESKTKNNILGDISSIIGGADATAQLDLIKDQLQTETKIKELQASLKTKEAEWAKTITDLPKPEAAKEVLEKIRATKIDASNLATAKKQLETIKADIATVDEMIKAYKDGQKTLEQDISNFNASLREIDEASKKDLAALQNRFKIPTIDKDSITKSLLSKLLGDKLSKLTRFIDQAKAYLPDQTKNESNVKPDFVPHPRGSGRTYKFPVTTGYPLVWLKRAELSSQSTPDGFSGDFSGLIMNVTTDPQLIKSPLTLELKGSAPKQNLHDMRLKLLLEQQSEQNIADLELFVGAHPLPEQNFTSGEDVEFTLLPSTARLRAAAKFTGSELQAKIDQNIDDPKFKTSAKSDIVAEALKTATARIKKLNMTITLAGNWSHQKIGLDSNLGSELAAGFQVHLKQKLDQAREKLKSFVDARIGSEKSALLGEYSKIRGSLEGILKAKDGDFKSLQAELQKALKDKTNVDSEKSRKDIENKAKDLFKKIKI
jgi:uncharacterized protein (TIGR03545 family)